MTASSAGGVKRRKGFSIIETLLSATILVVGTLALLGLIAGNIRDALLNREVIIATELAQEGVEIVRWIRDQNFIEGNDGFPNTSFNSSRPFCRAGHLNSQLVCHPDKTIGGGENAYILNYNPGGGINSYKHTGAGATKYHRYLWVNFDAGEPKADVISFVYWGDYFTENDGKTTNCTVNRKCVFVRNVITSWK